METRYAVERRDVILRRERRGGVVVDVEKEVRWLKERR